MMYTRNGRQIACNGRPLISIRRDGKTEPVVADALANWITYALNTEAIDLGTLRGDWMARPTGRSVAVGLPEGSAT